MSKRGLNSLGKPPKGFNPAKRSDCGSSISFETSPESWSEDIERGTNLRRAAATFADNDPQAKKARKMAKQLGREEMPTSLASKRFSRVCRRNIVGHVWRLIVDEWKGRFVFWTIIPRDWEVEEDDLINIDPRQLLESFRADLNRIGLKGTGGVGWFALDAEYDPEGRRFRLHLHGITTGKMTKMLEGLCSLRRYKLPDVEHVGQRQGPPPVHKRRYKSNPIPKTLTYVMKLSCWKTITFENAAGKQVRGKYRRMPDRAHALWSLWIDQWTVNDVSQLFGMRVRGRRLYASGK